MSSTTPKKYNESIWKPIWLWTWNKVQMDHNENPASICSLQFYTALYAKLLSPGAIHYLHSFRPSFLKYYNVIRALLSDFETGTTWSFRSCRKPISSPSAMSWSSLKALLYDSQRALVYKCASSVLVRSCSSSCDLGSENAPHCASQYFVNTKGSAFRIPVHNVSANESPFNGTCKSLWLRFTHLFSGILIL